MTTPVIIDSNPVAVIVLGSHSGDRNRVYRKIVVFEIHARPSCVLSGEAPYCNIVHRIIGDGERAHADFHRVVAWTVPRERVYPNPAVLSIQIPLSGRERGGAQGFL